MADERAFRDGFQWRMTELSHYAAGFSPIPGALVTHSTGRENGEAVAWPSCQCHHAAMASESGRESRQQTTRRNRRATVLLTTLDVLGKLWTLPYTLLGVAIGLPAIGLGSKIGFGNNAIRFERFPFGCGALTLGNCVIYARGTTSTDTVVGMYGDPRCLCVGRHEQAHTYQYQLLGPLFLPVYFLAGGISARNPLERAANEYAAGGSWWSRDWR
jgi:hypothetical protein